MTGPYGGEDAGLSGGGFSAELWLSHTEETKAQGELQRRIWEEIRNDSEADRGDVAVEVEDFIATLTGSVPSERTRIAVQHAAERVHGVRGVTNRLTVGPP